MAGGDTYWLVWLSISVICIACIYVSKYMPTIDRIHKIIGSVKNRIHKQLRIPHTEFIDTKDIDLKDVDPTISECITIINTVNDNAKNLLNFTPQDIMQNFALTGQFRIPQFNALTDDFAITTPEFNPIIQPDINPYLEQKEMVDALSALAEEYDIGINVFTGEIFKTHHLTLIEQHTLRKRIMEIITPTVRKSKGLEWKEFTLKLNIKGKSIHKR
jgi:hypothetical protein